MSDWSDEPCIPYRSLDERGRAERVQRAGVRKAAYTWVWIDANGPIPDGKQINHHCDNPACIVLSHLYAGTHQENMDDMMERRRHASQRQTHCKRGHEFNEENTTFLQGRTGPERRCKVCINMLQNARWQKNHRKAS